MLAEILVVYGSDRTQYRLERTEIIRPRGVDFTGYSLSELLSCSFLGAIDHSLQTVVRTGVPSVVAIHNPRSSIDVYSHLALPLSDDDTTVNMILRCMSSKHGGFLSYPYVHTDPAQPSYEAAG